MFSEYSRKIEADNSVVSCNYIQLQRFQRSFSKLTGKRRVLPFKIQPNDTQKIGYVCADVVKTTDIVIKRKSAVQKFVLSSEAILQEVFGASKITQDSVNVVCSATCECI